MANNKVQLADGTVLMDITDTTAEASDVAAGKYFYNEAGVRTLGTAPSGNIPSPSDDTPQPLGTASPGVSDDYSRADHVHQMPVIPTKVSDLQNDSGFITGMEILSYGSSTWADFLAAYNAKKVVYCRASSNSNPASGSQTRLAFMAYVNNAASPTSVEFQYYRSVSSHSATQQGDQVYVYKLESNGTWSVTVREAYTKIVAGTGLSSSYSNGVLTLSVDLTTWQGGSY